MRLFIDGQEFEARVQKREVIYVDLMRSGKFLARGEAIRNPLDPPNDQDGIKLAAERALRSLVPVVPALSSFFYRFHKGREIVGKYYEGKIRPVIKALDKLDNLLGQRINQLKKQQNRAVLKYARLLQAPYQTIGE